MAQVAESTAHGQAKQAQILEPEKQTSAFLPLPRINTSSTTYPPSRISASHDTTLLPTTELTHESSMASLPATSLWALKRATARATRCSRELQKLPSHHHLRFYGPGLARTWHGHVAAHAVWEGTDVHVLAVYGSLSSRSPRITQRRRQLNYRSRHSPTLHAHDIRPLTRVGMPRRFHSLLISAPELRSTHSAAPTVFSFPPSSLKLRLSSLRRLISRTSGWTAIPLANTLHLFQ